MRIAVTAFLMGLMAWPGVAQATSLRLADGTPSPEPYQGWLDGAHVPGPAVEIVVSYEPCPLPLTENCATATTAGGNTAYTIHLSADGRIKRVFFHEVGHVLDYTMPEWARDRFRAILHDYREWRSGPNPLSEQFADAYSLCARKRRLRGLSSASFRYSPTPRQHRRVCALVWNAVEPVRVIG